jgi:hypothetical protein
MVVNSIIFDFSSLYGAFRFPSRFRCFQYVGAQPHAVRRRSAPIDGQSDNANLFERKTIASLKASSHQRVVTIEPLKFAALTVIRVT